MAHGGQASAEVRRALQELAPLDRAVVVELYYRGKTAKETATTLGVTEAAVTIRAYFALRQLRDAMVFEAVPR